MKLVAFLVGLVLINMSPNVHSKVIPTSCDIKEVLEAKSLPSNSYAVTGYGDYEEATEVIVPVKIKAGTYSESLSRKGDNLYKLNGVNLFFKTSMCYEYAYGQDAIIEIDIYGGYTLGEITFK